jgi:hypothetical protein
MGPTFEKARKKNSIFKIDAISINKIEVGAITDLDRQRHR